MKTLDNGTLRRQAGWGRQTIVPSSFMGYIETGDKQASITQVRRKCLQQPGFLARGRRLLLENRFDGTTDRLMTREN